MNLLDKIKILVEEVEAMADAYPEIVVGYVPKQKKKKKAEEEKNIKE